MKDPSLAISYESGDDYVLRFGGGSDLRISNCADSNENSYAAILNSYTNEKYSKTSEGYEKFTGSKTMNFGIKEWEVWNVM